MDQPTRTLDRRHFLQLGGIASLGVVSVIAVSKVVAQGSGPTGNATPGASPSASPSASPVANTSPTVQAGELFFKPTSLTIPANTDVTITLDNVGVLSHDMSIEGTDFAASLTNPGTKSTFKVNLPAGTYEFICTVEGHADAGMVGHITAK